MPRVHLTTANHHTMPKRCVCCGEPTQNLVEEVGRHTAAKSSATASMRFPICPPCLAHAAYDAGVVPYGQRPPRSATCEGTLCLADFVSWKGADHIIDFDSPRYARLFVAANEADKKKVWCDYAWIPPASRVTSPSSLGMQLGYGSASSPPGSSAFGPPVTSTASAPPYAPAAPFAPSAPPFPPAAPARTSAVTWVALGVILLLVGVCTLAAMAPAPTDAGRAPIAPVRVAAPAPEARDPQARDPQPSARRRHRRERDPAGEAPAPTDPKAP